MASVLSFDESIVQVKIEDNNVKVNVCENVAEITISNTGPQGPRGTQVLSGVGAPDISLGLIGDQYIDTNSGYLYGPKTSSGWGTGVPLGNNDPNDLGQIYTQTTPATEWNIVHTLAFTPNIIVVDTAGTEVEGDYEYVSPNHIRATFTSSLAGKAILS
jgi:hypothetical protein